LRNKEKIASAPWLAVYKLPEWKLAKWQTHARDGYRCTFTDRRGRCTATVQTSTIEAHHVRRLWQLWQDANGVWEKFVPLALNQRNLVTLCWRHHMAEHRPGRKGRFAASADRRRKTTTRRG
jgi:hypothetical protein